MSNALKPCRRCGLDVTLDGIEVKKTSTGKYTARLECPHCGELAESSLCHTFRESAISDVVSDWNMRWTNPKMLARIDELEDIVRKLTGRAKFRGDETILYAAHKETVAYKDKQIAELKQKLAQMSEAVAAYQVIARRFQEIMDKDEEYWRKALVEAHKLAHGEED